MEICDKCETRVPPHNDALRLDGFRKKAGLDAILNMVSGQKTRHLLPVIRKGKVICEGSPSRAQYLPGQPRDTRKKYHYSKCDERDFRQAYKKLLKKYPPGQ